MEKLSPTLRERHAAQTREAVLDAARELFVSQGYSQTTVQQVAEKAGVSVQTIYTSVGGKGEVLAALVRQMDVDAGARTIAKDFDAAKDARELLALGIGLIRTFPERNGDLLELLESTAASEPALREQLEAGRARHRGGVKGLIKRISITYGLREGLSEKRAAAIMASMTNFHVFRELHEVHGWSYDEISDWMVDALARVLLD